MTRIKFIPSAIAILMSFRLLGQDSQFPVSLYPEGITVSYGIGSYSLIDEYISGERYSGGLPLLSINWARLHDRYTYQLELEYRGSQGIENYNVSTGITQFTLNQGFLYPLKKSSLFRKDLYDLIMPSHSPAFSLWDSRVMLCIRLTLNSLSKHHSDFRSCLWAYEW